MLLTGDFAIWHGCRCGRVDCCNFSGRQHGVGGSKTQNNCQRIFFCCLLAVVSTLLWTLLTMECGRGERKDG